MLKKTLSLLLAALIIIAPLGAMALTESDWNKGCRFKTNTEVILYTRSTDGKVNTFDPFGTLPAGSYISVVSTEIDGKRQISYFSDGATAYAWIDVDTWEWAVYHLELDGTHYYLPELAWAERDENAIREYMRYYFSNAQINAVLEAMAKAGPAETIAPSATLIPTPAALPTAEPIPADTNNEPVPEVTPSPAEIPEAEVTAEPTAEPVAEPVALPTAIPSLTIVGTAPAARENIDYLEITYDVDGATGTAKLIRLGTAYSVIAIGNTTYSIETSAISWETEASEGNRIAVVNNVVLSSYYLRKRGNSDSPRLANVPAGAVLAVLEDSNGNNYTHVCFNGMTGYIATSLLSFTDGEDPLALGVLCYEGSTVGNRNVVLWSSPSLMSRDVGKWPIGTVVTVLEYTDNWVRVEVDGYQGWVRRESVTF